MTKKIFRGILSTALLTMLACLIFIIGVQYQFYGEAQLKSLESEAFIISRSLENGADIEGFRDCGDRITLIAADGTVLFDNLAEPSALNNHLERPEIKKALKDGSGSALRYSDTLSGQTCYYALRLSDGSFLRIAADRASVITVLIKLSPPISAIIILTAIIALSLASVITKNVLKPINSFDPENPANTDSYEELAPLIRKLRHQKNKINKQISQLMQSKREFEIISENMCEGMLLTDMNGTVLTYNKSVRQLFCLNEDITGKSLLALRENETFMGILEGISTANHLELIHTEGSRFYEVTVNPVTDEIAGPCGAVVLVIDVTQRLENEKLRREFTANVSHELKTPLTSILGFSEILKEGIAEPEVVKDFGADINKETKRLITLVNDIIKLSRLDEGILPPEEELINLKASALEVQERLRNVAEAQGISLTVSGEDAAISAGSSLIFELIYNLCDNAVKYNRVGGSVSIVTGENEGHPFVTVKDTGIGIEAEHLPRIFERFYRVDKSRSNTKGGTGLGLSIVKHIASLCRGTISIESEPNRGTEITVYFSR